MSSASNIKVCRKGFPDKGDVALIGYEAIVYIRSDYTNNILILETIKQGLLDAKYDENCIEIEVINDLIEEYKNKWVTAYSDAISTFLGETIEEIATKNPVLSIVSVAATIASELEPIEEKVKLHALAPYREGLSACLGAVDKFYYYGTLATTSEKLNQYVSLYLGIMEKSNELSLTIANESNDYDSEEARQKDITRLNEQLAFIRELQELYAWN